MKIVKEIVNHPLSKAVAAGAAGAVLLFESHPLYAGICIGIGIREVLLAFKKD